MSALPDGIYEAMVVDVDIDERDDIARVELVIVTGAHKGDVVPLRGDARRMKTTDVVGLPATLTITDGVIASVRLGGSS